MTDGKGEQSKDGLDDPQKTNNSIYRYKRYKSNIEFTDVEYFRRLKRSYEYSKRAREKVKPVNESIKKRLQTIKSKLFKCKNEEEKTLLRADFSFFSKCLPALDSLKQRIDDGLKMAERIFETGIKGECNLIVDFQIRPCPSERADQKKDKDKKKDAGKNKNEPVKGE